MTPAAILQAGIFLAALLLLAEPLGRYLARIYGPDFDSLPGSFRRLDRLSLRLMRIRPGREMTWAEYAEALLVFNLAGIVLLYVIQRLQHILPLNPQAIGSVDPFVAFNTAVSFVTNTNWQVYGGESRMSYFTQAAGLTVQNFASAATGLAVLAALVRGLTRERARTLGNFWVDLARGVLFVLLPLSLLLALVLVPLGVVQTFSPYSAVETAGSGGAQIIALGPVASQVAIKQLGTNGGGFFNANAAHPLENPTPFSNFLELLAILLLPAASCVMFGRLVSDRRQGRAILATMTALFLAFLVVATVAEQAGTPALRAAGVDLTASALQPGGNMEGKEVRFGVSSSALWATATTAASNGSVNAMHDSFTPIGGMVPLILIQLGEVVFGGVGSGLYGMLVFVILAVFVAGLMVGRTPEYLGKKIGTAEMKLASLIILVGPLLVLIGTAFAVSLPAGRSAALNPGPHGFSEILYAFSSTANNNGSAFAGLDAARPLYAVLAAVMMFLGRFWVIIPTLALAGALGARAKVPPGDGTLPTHGWTFVLVVGALTFFPSLALGPLAEALQPGL